MFSDTSTTLDAGYLQNTSTIADAATPTIDFTLSNHFLWVLGDDRAFPDVTPSAAGCWLFELSGNYTLSYDASYSGEVFGDTYDASGTNANFLLYLFDGTNRKLFLKSIAVAA